MQILSSATLTTIDMNAFAAAYKKFADSLFAVTFSISEILDDTFGNSDNELIQLFKELQMDKVTDELAEAVNPVLTND